jgi:hypothetical protein
MPPSMPGFLIEIGSGTISAGASTGAAAGLTSTSGGGGAAACCGGGGGGGGGGDETPSFIIDDVSFVEGNSGNTDFVFTVSLVPPDAVNTHTVDFSTSGISATSGVDFLPTSGTLTFNPGVSTQTVTVEVVGDTTVEGTEDFQVNLSSSSGPPIGDATGIGTILNDDLGDGR